MGLAGNIITVVAITILAVGGYFGNFYIDAGSGYTAKVVCSGLYTSGRSLEHILEEDLSFIPITLYSVVLNDRSVTASTVLGLFPRTSVYDPKSNSCSLLGPGSNTLQHSKSSGPLTSQTKNPSSLAVDNSLSNINYANLNLILDAAFHEPNVKEAGVFRRSRGIVVLYNGKIIGERYAPGFSADTPLIGWSMTEALFSSVLGKRVSEGKLKLDSTHLFKQWNDQRANITLAQLLLGTSGLSLSNSEHTEMVYLQNSVANYAIEKSTLSSSWSHFTGASNLLSRLLRESFGSRQESDPISYWNFVREFLDSIGMTNTVIDTDSVGDFVASSFGYATTRDWANYGNFILNRGKVNDKQILPADWFDKVLTPVANSPLRKQAGGGFWLNVGSVNNPQDRLFPNLPSDAIFAFGAEEQSLTIIPSRNLVVARLGCTHPKAAWYTAGFVEYILDSVIQS